MEMTQNLNVIKTVSSLGKGYGGGGIYKTNNGKNRELTKFELHLYKMCSTTL
jgi:hypothetical protein